MIRVYISREGTPVRDVSLGGEITIGRSDERELQLEDPQVSRLHAVVKEEQGACVVTDRGSINGTYLGGAQLAPEKPTRWLPGESLVIREFTLVYGSPESHTVDGSGPGEEGLLEKTLAVDHGVAAFDSAIGILRTHLVEGFESGSEWTRGEQTLVVSDIIRETHDVNTFRLVGEEPQSFRYEPGQFIGLSLQIDGKTVKRSYSISSSPSRPLSIDITVKRIPGGLVSNWLPDHLEVGDKVTCRAPAGRFSCFQHPAPKMLFLAAGSGVTPLMSMLRWITDVSAPVDVVVLNSVRSPEDVIFGRELESMAARHPNVKITVTTTDSKPSLNGWIGMAGRLNAKWLDAAVPDLLEREVFLCGPTPFSAAMTEQLAGLGLPKERLHQESFGSGAKPKKEAPSPNPSPRRAPALPATPASEGADARFQVRFALSDVSAEASDDLSLLELAEEAGLDLPHGCRSGSCGACKTRLRSGSVDMDDHDLTDEELSEGWIYVCTSHARSHIELEA
jgi:ferredoxin-NADP reductase